MILINLLIQILTGPFPLVN